MTEQEAFKTWAIVEVMGHNEYAGFVSSESIAGAAMLRVDVPDTSTRPAFTKYLSTSAVYGISPCSEETARARAESSQATPVASWNVEQQVLNNLRQKGLLIEHKPPEQPEYGEDEDEQPFLQGAMTPAEFRKIGEQLYGPRWQTKLARAVPVNSRTVRRWLAGERRIHAGMAERIRGLLAEKSVCACSE